MIDARRERRLTRVVDDVVMGNQEKNVLPIGPWTRETLDLPRAIVQGMLSGSVFPLASFFAPQGFAAAAGPFVVAVLCVAAMLVALRVWARPGGVVPLEIDREGVWIWGRDPEGHRTRHHIALAQLHAMRARRGWIAFLDDRGGTLFVVPGTEHRKASLLAEAARTTAGPPLDLPGVTTKEAWRLHTVLLAHALTVGWMVAVARAPVPLSWFVGLAMVPLFGIGLVRQARAAPSVDILLRPTPTYREPAA